MLELTALSCKELFLVFYHDKVVLYPQRFFLPKVLWAFNFNQNFVLPSICPNPRFLVDKVLHTLDVVCAIRISLKSTAMI